MAQMIKSVTELTRHEQELKNLIEINEEQVDVLDKKMKNQGLTKEEDHRFLKLIFEGMELESKRVRIRVNINTLQFIARSRLNRVGTG